MVHLRATRKARRWLGPASSSSVTSDTALGDWFVDRFVIDRQPLLILVSSASLLSILEPARDVRSLPDRLASIVAARLRRLGVGEAQLRSEIAAMDDVRVAPTNDRSVVGSMVNFVRSLRYCAPIDRSLDEATRFQLETMLEETPCRVTGPYTSTVFPAERAQELLARNAD